MKKVEVVSKIQEIVAHFNNYFNDTNKRLISKMV